MGVYVCTYARVQRSLFEKKPCPASDGHVNIFGEDETEAKSDGTCCNVCELNYISCSLECKSELAKLLKALETLGGIGEVKLAECMVERIKMLVGLRNSYCTTKAVALMEVEIIILAIGGETLHVLVTYTAS